MSELFARITRNVIVLLSFAVLQVASQTPQTATRRTATSAVVRTPWGDPDLQGVYTTDEFTGVPLERSKEFGERNVLTDEEYAKKVEQIAEQIEGDSEERVVPRQPK